jgi:uncharacterized protein DUF2844
MKSRLTKLRHTTSMITLLIGAALAIPVSAAYAALGGNLASVASDATAMGASMSPAGTQTASSALSSEAFSTTSWTTQSFVTPRGVTVREYIGNSGVVFGVAWQGHRPPDLSTLLGSYYAEYASASTATRHKDLHRAKYAGTDVVVTMAGHMGRITGSAYVASLAPADVDPSAVVK